LGFTRSSDGACRGRQSLHVNLRSAREEATRAWPSGEGQLPQRAGTNGRSGAGATSPARRNLRPQSRTPTLCAAPRKRWSAPATRLAIPMVSLVARTVAAIKRFQTDRYLPVSGQLDEGTIAALGVSNAATGALSAHVATLSDPVNALVSSSNSNGQLEVLAATSAGLYRTADPNQGWDRLPYGRGMDPRTTCISTSTQNPSVILVGTASTGVLISRDAGQNWQQVSGVPTTSPVNVIFRIHNARHSSM